MPTKPANETTRQPVPGYPSKDAENLGRVAGHGGDNLAPVQPGKRGHDLDADLNTEKRGNAVVKDEDEDDENSAHDRAERVEGDDEDQRH
ncbi:MAG: hypothetical protein AB7M05_17910 [Alphaproteobacteria bacterium]